MRAGATHRPGGRRACGATALALAASIWRVGVACPLGPPRRAATPASPESSTCVPVLRMQPGSAGGPAGPLLPPTRHSGAGCGGLKE